MYASHAGKHVIGAFRKGKSGGAPGVSPQPPIHQPAGPVDRL